MCEDEEVRDEEVRSKKQELRISVKIAPPVRLLTPYFLLLTSKPRRRGFTLTELLTVILIIGVLIGILIPATAAARYRARMVKCASNLRQVGQGVMAYAADNGGNYPPRTTTFSGYKATWIYCSAASEDQRFYLKNYIDFNRLNCPFTPQTLDYQNVTNTQSIEWTYQLWWGIQYQNGNNDLFASRVGRPFTCKALYPGTKFTVLACDSQYDWTSGGTDGSFTSEGQHPTTAMSADVRQDSIRYYARWDNANTVRGPVDLNFLYNDGSVSNITKIGFNYWKSGDANYRADVVNIPAFFTTTTGWMGVMPAGH